LGESMESLSEEYIKENEYCNDYIKNVVRKAFIAGASAGYDRVTDFISLTSWYPDDPDQYSNNDESQSEMIENALYEHKSQILSGAFEENNTVSKEQNDYYRNL